MKIPKRQFERSPKKRKPPARWKITEAKPELGNAEIPDFMTYEEVPSTVGNMFPYLNESEGIVLCIRCNNVNL